MAASRTGDGTPDAVPPSAPEAAGERGLSFYGRRVGKPLRAAQIDALKRVLPRVRLDLDHLAHDPAAVFGGSGAGRPRDLYLEIGFGGGEHLISEAARLPDVGFIGVEPFVNGMARAMMDLDAAGLANVRVFDQDAALLLARLPAATLGRAELLYPDPWPKRRHWKRRFVRPDNLDLLARAIRPGGLFRFASDVPDYVDWTLRELARHEGFRWIDETADQWRRPYEGWPGTRYEAKALKDGRVPTYLTFERV